jgi:hypothetical protein
MSVSVIVNCHKSLVNTVNYHSYAKKSQKLVERVSHPLRDRDEMGVMSGIMQTMRPLNSQLPFPLTLAVRTVKYSYYEL